ncbi:hypothetical protein [Sphingomonas paeninsulae]|uniref:hypothetical protein n=1 Tax=Sphingomonas paeninsulae TaxID=2319844 RepID=UPI0013CEFC9A|nr:hypothetical protein [Sphingomonas paeninsulae]
MADGSAGRNDVVMNVRPGNATLQIKNGRMLFERKSRVAKETRQKWFKSKLMDGRDLAPLFVRTIKVEFMLHLGPPRCIGTYFQRSASRQESTLQILKNAMVDALPKPTLSKEEVMRCPYYVRSLQRIPKPGLATQLPQNALQNGTADKVYRKLTYVMEPQNFCDINARR